MYHSDSINLVSNYSHSSTDKNFTKFIRNAFSKFCNLKCTNVHYDKYGFNITNILTYLYLLTNIYVYIKNFNR